MEPGALQEIDFLKTRHPDSSSLAIAEAAVRRGLRVDGRTPSKYRKIAVEFLTSSGRAIVSFGNTRVFCAVSGEIVESSERPGEGFFLHVEMAPFTSHSYEPGKMNEQELFISHYIERAFKETGALDVESLCISNGKHVSFSAALMNQGLAH
ncbi:bifunctional PNPase-RNase PH domain superfamily/Ribosomal protein S5 domain 2-type fold/Exoribonuclease [Babesia duncani]|uniref:Bifunctional PNPase-RNase PH domain superfamily/Ribosomal protein S5 domain 2-type fold/Exoribonuclease n=1 Tax=Babesia duncani TaxID=323732 RepID=A0AAD9UQF0_9APIC|nr:bifunctional PNPase-RNase PH domain superfamily/Ribosomal protein S5 domain 2-type fold/Exoribonuclease [Babesia duncani]